METSVPDFFFQTGDGTSTIKSSPSPNESGGKRKTEPSLITFSRRQRPRKPEIAGVSGTQLASNSADDSTATVHASSSLAGNHSSCPVPSVQTSSKPPKKSWTQMHLDFGQANFVFTTCKICDMMYAKGQEADEKLHSTFHGSCVEGVRVQEWQEQRVLGTTQAGERVLALFPEDPKSKWNKVGSVCEIMEKQLGMSNGYLLSLPCKVFLMVNTGKHVIGCLVTEASQTAFPAVLQGADDSENVIALANASAHPIAAARPAAGCESGLSSGAAEPKWPCSVPREGVYPGRKDGSAAQPEDEGRRSRGCDAKSLAAEDEGQGISLIALDKAHPKQAMCGVRGIWVSLSARRKGVASHLLDAARLLRTYLNCEKGHKPPWVTQVPSQRRCHCIQGNVICREEVAFSQPTNDGLLLALSYTGRRDFLAY